MTATDKAHFFTVGGTLRADAESYVSRPADRDLIDRVLAGQYCYVLTARQMGKSSLMVRTMARLGEQSVRSVKIDLSGIGAEDVDVSQWYLGLLSRLRSGLRLKSDIQSWWLRHESRTPSERFIAFVRNVVLTEVPESIVVFIDEIDSTLKLAFRDDFFAALRALHNNRADDPEYGRICFVLLGVAAPSDLVQDRSRTGFNIGRRIVLDDLAFGDATPLYKGLEDAHSGQGGTLLQHIFAWTHGHPYLTQKLCAEAALHPETHWDSDAVQKLVEQCFFSSENRDDNLDTIKKNIAARPLEERRAMLKLYRDIYRGKGVADDSSSLTQNYLELTGLVRVEHGKLVVRNEIYRRTFDEAWLRGALPQQRSRWLAGIVSVLALVLVFSAFFIYYRSQPTGVALAALQSENFQSALGANAAGVRFDALAELFRLGEPQHAIDLFYSLEPQAQLEVLRAVESGDAERALLVVRHLVGTVDADMPDDHDRALFNAMNGALIDTQASDSTGQVATLIALLNDWVAGRNTLESDPALAVDLLTAAMARVERGPDTVEVIAYSPLAALSYDRALAALGNKDYGLALVDLESTLVLTALRQRIEQSFTDEALLNQYNIAIEPYPLFATNRFAVIDDQRLRPSMVQLVVAESGLSAALLADPANYQRLAAPELLSSLSLRATATSLAATDIAATAQAEAFATRAAEMTTLVQRASATARAGATFVSATQKALAATEAAAATATARAIPTNTPPPPTPRPAAPTARPAQQPAPQQPAPTAAPPADNTVPIPIIPGG